MLKLVCVGLLALLSACANTPYGTALNPVRDIYQMSGLELQDVPLHWLCVAQRRNSGASGPIMEEMRRRGIVFTPDEAFLLEHSQGLFLGMSEQALQCTAYPWMVSESWNEAWGKRTMYVDETGIVQVIVDSGSITAIRVCDLLDATAMVGQRRLPSSLSRPRLFRPSELSSQTFPQNSKLHLILATGQEIPNLRLEKIESGHITARSGEHYSLQRVRFVGQNRTVCPPRDSLEEWWEWFGPF